MDDFDAIAFGEGMLGVAPARDDVAVDFDRDAAVGEAFALEQLQHGQGGVERAELAVEQDVHAGIVARCRAVPKRSRCRLCGFMPAWFDCRAIRGRTRPRDGPDRIDKDPA